MSTTWMATAAAERAGPVSGSGGRWIAGGAS
jgi:hypothetical protein